MSRRTSEANKAILAAWNKEQELVQEGKGTREWTSKQQQDILDKGKAYDEDGVAFQGQHMKSAEKHPEYQGYPENIQFLTRAEHLEAHDGNWKNLTNWYFDPITKEKTQFGEVEIIPCKIIRLQEPIINQKVEQLISKEIVQEKSNSHQKKITPDRIQENSKIITPKMDDIEVKPKLSFGQNLNTIFKTGIDKIVEFQVKHPTASKIIKEVGFVAATVAVSAAVESITSNSSSKSENKELDDYQRNNNNAFCYDEDLSEYDSLGTIERSSADEHTVKEHGQHYHTKEGVIWKEKESFTRGGKKDE